ncbi:MAG: leucine-rich repeat protein, partial [Oscillospiraceae bacterium]
ERCENLVAVTLPNTVETIGYSAFGVCTALSSINVPDSVKKICGAAFFGTKVYNEKPDGIVYFGNWVVDYKGEMGERACLSIKDGTIGIADNAFMGREQMLEITIPNSLSYIGQSAFYECKILRNVYMPSGIKEIEDSTFGHCTSFTDVKIGENVTSIGEYAFDGCVGINNLSIPKSVTSIGGCAFTGCLALLKAVIPKTVTSIGEIAFGFNINEANGQCENIRNFKIVGAKNSKAQDYASFYGIEFVVQQDCGDVNFDGKITSADAIAVLRAEAQLIELSSLQKEQADVTKDGRVTSGDAIKILRYEAQLISSF